MYLTNNICVKENTILKHIQLLANKIMEMAMTDHSILKWVCEV